MTSPIPRFLLLLVCVLLTGASVWAQQDTSHFRRPGFSAESLFADSGKLTASDYTERIQEVYQILSHINSSAHLRREVKDLAGKLAECDSALQVVNRVVSVEGNATNVRNLQMFNVLLQNVQSDVASYESEIDTADNLLQSLKEEMRLMVRDTTLRQLVRDSMARRPFMDQLKSIRAKRRMADSLLRNGIAMVSQLKIRASSISILSSELTSKVNEKLRISGFKAFGKEMPYLWESGKAKKAAAAIAKENAGALNDEKKALNYYLKDAGPKRLLLLLFGAVFLWWIIVNIKVIRKAGMAHTFKHYHIQLLAMQPWASAFALMFSIAPLFDMNAPAVYVESMQFFLLIALTFLFYKQWPRQLFYNWLSVIALFLLFTWVEHTTTPTLLRRYTFIILNIASIVAWVTFLRRLPEEIALKRFIKVVIYFNFVLNVAAILHNAFGRISLSHQFATTAIFSFTSVMGLSVCYKIFTEAILLQVHASRVRQGIQKSFEVKVVTEGFRKPLFAVLLFIWLVELTTNLNMYGPLAKGISGFLSIPRSIGSISFTFGSVALFFLIIMLAHMLQRYIGYFMGAVDDEEEEGAKGQRSRLLMTKLILITAGYLLAVAASGLPVDKITIVLGALGVGIGMGLQNIVNNFVSGIILIFDRPLQIGDSVDVGSKSGKVKEIGLRSSTLFTPDGAEVIIPNGDILSQQITNWTFSNSYKRLDISVTIAGAADKETLEKLITDALSASPFVLDQKQPVILFEKQKGTEISMKVYFWCTDVQKAELAKSSALFLLYKAVTEKGLELK
ncbi:Small-conductance mechanosensitive channel [Filimonas lacunae]|uniref:Small-conductance mechanosensitive channel n=1 Tax=Filimonas lacunae TaxID=477680 RepID=A0A173MSB5_9BACT|nr:mechanosensitive ion channel domain-containing protein [Filimonas lacunae]BAV10311.1 mechanosensitive ion channel protein MscS [Filimonas lacunae]SIT17203.1 Small-conductance mechanosensitive channel [Filimonas lacunae]